MSRYGDSALAEALSHAHENSGISGFRFHKLEFEDGSGAVAETSGVMHALTMLESDEDSDLETDGGAAAPLPHQDPALLLSVSSLGEGSNAVGDGAEGGLEALSSQIDVLAEQQHAAAARIQAGVRGSQTRKEHRRQHEAAKNVQRVARGRMARRRVAEMRGDGDDVVAVGSVGGSDTEDNLAGRRGGDADGNGDDEYTDDEFEAEEARHGPRDRRDSFSLDLFDTKVGHAAATNVQRVVRGRAARRQVHNRRRDAAAVQLQRVARGRRARKRAAARRRGVKLSQREGWNDRHHIAATSIQRVSRGHLSRRRVRRKRKRRRAAVTIQRVARGRMARKRVTKLRRQRQQRKRRRKSQAKRSKPAGVATASKQPVRPSGTQRAGRPTRQKRPTVDTPGSTQSAPASRRPARRAPPLKGVKSPDVTGQRRAVKAKSAQRRGQRVPLTARERGAHANAPRSRREEVERRLAARPVWGARKPSKRRVVKVSSPEPVRPRRVVYRAQAPPATTARKPAVPSHRRQTAGDAAGSDDGGAGSAPQQLQQLKLRLAVSQRRITFLKRKLKQAEADLAIAFNGKADGGNQHGGGGGRVRRGRGGPVDARAQAQLEARVRQLQRSIHEKDSRISVLESEHVKAERVATSRQQEIAKLKRDVVSASKAKSAIEEDKRKLEHSVRDLKVQIKALKGDVRDRASRIHSHDEELVSLRSVVGDLTRQRNEAEEEVVELRKDLAAARLQMDQLRRTNAVREGAMQRVYHRRLSTDATTYPSFQSRGNDMKQLPPDHRAQRTGASKSGAARGAARQATSRRRVKMHVVHDTATSHRRGSARAVNNGNSNSIDVESGGGAVAASQASAMVTLAPSHSRVQLADTSLFHDSLNDFEASEVDDPTSTTTEAQPGQADDDDDYDSDDYAFR